MTNSETIDLDNGFFQVKIKPDAFALGEYFASLNSRDQYRFLTGFVSSFESVNGQWAMQASYLAKEINGKIVERSGVNGESPYRQLIKYYLETLLEHINDK